MGGHDEGMKKAGGGKNKGGLSTDRLLAVARLNEPKCRWGRLQSLFPRGQQSTTSRLDLDSGITAADKLKVMPVWT